MEFERIRKIKLSFPAGVRGASEFYEAAKRHELALLPAHKTLGDKLAGVVLAGT